MNSIDLNGITELDDDANVADGVAAGIDVIDRTRIAMGFAPRTDAEKAESCRRYEENERLKREYRRRRAIESARGDRAARAADEHRAVVKAALERDAAGAEPVWNLTHEMPSLATTRRGAS